MEVIRVRWYLSIPDVGVDIDVNELIPVSQSQISSFFF